MISSVTSSFLPYTGTQCLAAVMSGCTTSIITNPLDLVRARVQVGKLRMRWIKQVYHVGPRTLKPFLIGTIIGFLNAISNVARTIIAVKLLIGLTCIQQNLNHSRVSNSLISKVCVYMNLLNIKDYNIFL